MIFGGVYTPEWSLQGRCRRFRAVFFPCPTPKQAINPRQPCEKRHFCRLGQNNENVQVATQATLFSVVSRRATHTPENIETQIFVCLSIAWRADNASSYRDVCRAWQILRLCQAYLFLTFPRGFTHTSKLSNAFYGHLQRFLAFSHRDTH